MKTRNIIFLDFDGVITTNRLERSGFGWWFDPRCIQNFNLIENNVENLEIVISSSWRNSYTLPSLRRLLRAVGISSFVIGKTARKGDRGFEIVSYLDKFCYKDEVKFAILDDDSFDIVNYFDDLSCFFQTDSMIGLSKEISLEVISFFNESRND
jgi:hypothetical protein